MGEIRYRFEEIDRQIQQYVQNSSNVHRIGNLRVVLQALEDDVSNKEKIMDLLGEFAEFVGKFNKSVIKTIKGNHIARTDVEKIKKDVELIKQLASLLAHVLEDSI